MDFGGELFWVAMLIFYLVFQVLGARKKQQEHKKRRPTGPMTEGGATSAEPRQENELDEALSEIRRALGYPDQGREEPAPVETDRRPVEKPLEGLSARDEPSRFPPPRREPLEGRSLRNEPSRIPPQREPLESRSLRDEASRIPPPSRKASRPGRVERRTPMYGGSIYAADEGGTFSREEAFEKVDTKQASASLPSGPKGALPATASLDAEKTSLPHLVKRLQTPSFAREAILLKEIFGPPRAMRRRR